MTHSRVFASRGIAYQYWLSDENRLHREDGPAVIHLNGTEEWFVHGKRHRVGGPAVFGPDGNVLWFLNDHIVTSKEAYQTMLNLSDEDMLLLILKYGDIG